MVMLHSANFSESSAGQEPLAVDSTITGHSWMLNVTGMVTVVAERAALVVLSAVFASCILPPNFYSLNLREPSSPADNLKNPKYLSGSCALMGQWCHGPRVAPSWYISLMYNEDYYRNPDHDALERAVATSKWFVPSQVEAREGQLYPSFDDGPLHAVWASPSMLMNFLSLDGKRPQAFANYAKAWGVLGIHDDGEGWELSMSSIFVHPSRRDDSISVPVEHLSVWQFWIAQFRSIISVAWSISENRAPDAAEWERATDRIRINQSSTSPEQDVMHDEVYWSAVPKEYTVDDELWARQSDPSRRFDRKEARTYLYSVLFDLARFAQLVVFLCPDRQVIAVNTPGLLCGLTLQLVLAINRSAIVACSDCGDLFSPVRQARTERRVFCTKCGHQGAVKLAMRDYRARKRAKKETAV